MSELKTKQSDENVYQFIESYVDSLQKREDSYSLIKIMQEATGCEPKMWGDSMIGFGKYHYKSERSKQQGDWFLIGFSPRKAAISLYVYSGCEEQELLLSQLGKYKMGKACIYAKKLSDIQIDVLKKLMHSTLKLMQEKHTIIELNI